jgi:uncharacterized membrane protein (DUF106 family)
MLPVAYTLSLTAISIGVGFVLLFVVRRVTDQKRIELAKRKLRASLYAFRLFGDEPALIFRAQKELLLWNARYLGQMLRPTAFVIVPVVLLLTQLDAIYGRRPLRPGEAAVVTAGFDGATDLRTLEPSLEGRGITVETPPVRIPSEHEACWRVRAAGEVSGSVVLRGIGPPVAKTVQAGPGLHYLSERRAASLLEWLGDPAEARLPAGAVRWIAVAYPPADLDVFGLGVYWLVWFFAVSLSTMLVFRKRFGVTF